MIEDVKVKASKLSRRKVVLVVVAGLIVIAAIVGGVVGGLLGGKASTLPPATVTNSTSADLQGVGAIFHHSEPVQVNETVLATGGIWTLSDNLVVSVTKVDDDDPGSPSSGLTFNNSEIPWSLPTYSASIIQQTNYSIQFVIPDVLSSGVFAYQVWRLATSSLYTGPVDPQSMLALNATLVSSWRLLNAPTIWNIMGDVGVNASAGGWIGVYGICIQLGSPQMALVQGSTVYKLYPTTRADKGGNRWAQYFDIPSTIPFGIYTVWLHNGAGGASSWHQLNWSVGTSIRSTINIGADPRIVYGGPQARVVDVTLIPGANIDAKITSAFASNLTHGGVLYFPPGEYQLYKTITPPNNVVVRGAGKDLTTLVWQTATYPYHVIYVNYGFGLEDLTMRMGLMNQTTATNNCRFWSSFYKTGSGFAWIKSVRVANPTSAEVAATPPGCIQPYGQNRLTAAMILSNSENLAVDDWQVDDAQEGIYMNGGSNHTRCSNCRLYYRDASVRIIPNTVNFVFENSYRYFLGNVTSDNGYGGWQPGALIGLYASSSMVRDIVYMNVTSESETKMWADWTNADGKEGWYQGSVLSSSGRSLTLASNLRLPVYSLNGTVPVPSNYDLRLLLGSIVVVTSGTGTGLQRFVAGIQYDINTPTIILDSPFDIQLDHTSFVAISKMKGRVLAVNNDFNAEGSHDFAWLASDSVIYADNIVGAPYYLDPSNGTQSLYGNPTKDHEIGFSAGTRYQGIPNNSSYPGPGMAGSLMGHFYSQSIGNLIRPGSANGHYQWLSQSGGAATGQEWYGQMTFGNVIRNNINPNNKTFHITIGKYSGVTLVEGNTNLTLIDWDQSGSAQTVFRRNSMSKSILGSSAKVPVLKCGVGSVHTCGTGKKSNDTTTDCVLWCGGSKQVFTGNVNF